MLRPGIQLGFTFVAACLGASALHAQARKRPLAAGDINDIARVLMLENRREFDSATFVRLVSASHPEVRRRAVIAVGRILDRRGLAMLRAHALDADTALAATTVFAVGQFRDTASVHWLDSLLNGPRTAPTVATEAAIALGKVRGPSARDPLARYLNALPVTTPYSSTLGEAVLAIGRSTRGDIGPIVKWTSSPTEDLRWRAAWSLYRPRDPAAVPMLLSMSNDKSGLVRSWAVRGLARPQADSASLGVRAEAALIAATRDVDRRVQTEALRTLASYSDSAAVTAFVAALESGGTWVSVPAAEGLARLKATSTIPSLVAATSARRPCAVRAVSLQALQAISPGAALLATLDIAHDSVSYCRNLALQTLYRVESGATTPGADAPPRSALISALDSLRVARRADLAATDLATRLVALRAIAAWADSSDLAMITDVQRRSEKDAPAVAMLATGVITSVKRRLSAPAAPATPPSAVQPRPTPAPVAWPLTDYVQIVQRWVVPEYNGQAHHTARWTTPKGEFDIELFGGDAPLAADDFARTMQSGAMLGTEFTRVVSDFVVQQQAIRGGNVLRDEVNRRGLTRANLAWATAGLDTGNPGYTIGHTPQPHNEGDFTALGRVVRGMDVVDRLELGDRIVSAKMLP